MIPDAVTTEVDSSSEDLVLLVLIALVGALGVGIGLCAPGRTVEPAIGMLMVLFAARTFVRERLR